MTPEFEQDLLQVLADIARTEVQMRTTPELFFATTRRHRPDIYECNACGYRFPQDTACDKCGSRDMRLFMRAPSSVAVKVRFASNLHEDEREALLTEIDPDWRDHFQGDAERAMEFYRDELEPPKPRLGRVIHSSPFEPPTVIDEPREDPDAGHDDPEAI